MKKKNLLIYILLFILSISACNKKIDGSDLYTLNDSDKELVITLDANPSTGYTWKYSIDDESIAYFVSYNYSDVSTELVGAPCKWNATFKGLKEGSTSIKLEYSRSWENVKPAKSYIFYIDVSSDNTIKITSVESI